MKVEERYHRVNANTMELTVTIDDPKAYTKPWVARNKLPLRLMPPDTDLMEMIPSATEAAEYKKVFAAPEVSIARFRFHSPRSGRRTCRALPESFSDSWSLRHGMEQVLGYPEASDAARLSYEGIVELIAFPAALLIMLGLFTRPVALVLSVLYFILFFVGPLQRGLVHAPERRRSDPAELFLLSLSRRGRRRRLEPGPAAPSGQRGIGRCRWAPYALGILRIVAGCLFIMHGLEKFFSVGGGRHRSRHHDDARAGRVARDRRRAADHPRPASRVRRRSSCRARWRWPTSDRGRREGSGRASSCRAWKRRFCSASCSCFSGRQVPGPGVSTVCGGVNDVEDRHEGTTHGTRHDRGSGAAVRRRRRRNG